MKRSETELDILAALFYLIIYMNDKLDINEFFLELTTEKQQKVRQYYEQYMASERPLTDNNFNAQESIPKIDVETVYHTYTSFSGGTYEQRGLFVASETPSNKTVILLHGYKAPSGAQNALDYKWLTRGYNLLAIDFRGQGEGLDPHVSLGILETEDILNYWIPDFIFPKMGDKSEISIAGASQGGGTTLNVISHPNCPPNVTLGFAECGFISLEGVTATMFSVIVETLELTPLEEKDVLIITRKVDDLLLKNQGIRMEQGTNMDRLKVAKTPLFYDIASYDTYYRTSAYPYEMKKWYSPNKLILNVTGYEGHIATSLPRETVDHYIANHRTHPWVNTIPAAWLNIKRFEPIPEKDINPTTYFGSWDAVDGDLTSQLTVSGMEGITSDTYESSKIYPLTFEVSNTRGNTTYLEHKFEVYFTNDGFLEVDPFETNGTNVISGYFIPQHDGGPTLTNIKAMIYFEKVYYELYELEATDSKQFKFEIPTYPEEEYGEIVKIELMLTIKEAIQPIRSTVPFNK